MRWIFINNFGRLRSGWRVLVFIFAFLAAFLLLITVLRVLYLAFLALAPPIPSSRFLLEMIYRFALLSAALGAGYVCARFLERLPWRSLGLTLHQGWFRDLVIGSVVGFASLALAVGIATAGKGLKFSINDAPALSLAKSMLGSATLLIIAALAEEAMFRGYPLQTFARARLASLGLALTSMAFAFAHLGNPNVVPGGTITNTVLAGVWLAVGYLRTRSLWLPLGVHWSWNWALGWFFGIPISGANLVSNPVLKATDEGPAWLTGGNYGIEGGAACTVALLISTVFLWRAPWLRATPELKKLTSEETSAIPEPVLSIRPAEE
jgi:membrane protease YdiL (CAAX protease family)